MPLRWQPPKRRLTLTGTTGTRYLYSTGQALTVQEWNSSPLPRGDLRCVTLYNSMLIASTEKLNVEGRNQHKNQEAKRFTNQKLKPVTIPGRFLFMGL